MNKQRYEVQPEPFWGELHDEGWDGYDIMEKAEAYRWHPLSSWGRDGWNLGSWPYVVVYLRNPRKDAQNPVWELAVYCEGDMTTYRCPSLEERQAIIDDIALFYWKHSSHEAVRQLFAGYVTMDDMPQEMRGPWRVQ